MVDITVTAFPNSPLNGTSEGGAGVTGTSNTGAGVVGVSVGSPSPPKTAGTTAVTASGATTKLPPAGDGVQGTGENGVHGLSASPTNNGVLGENSSSGAGVRGTSVGGYGIYGSSASADGVYGESLTGFGLHGRNTYFYIGGSTSAPPTTTPTTLPPSAATTLKATECGVFGESLGFEGVFGTSAFQHGVHGVSGSTSGFKPAYQCGVWGESSAGYGVCATSGSTNGLWASSNADHGVHGETNSQSHAGVYAQNNSAYPCMAVLGSSASGHGVKGVNGAGSGKTSTNGAAGVWGDSDAGVGVYGASKTGNAGVFDGNVIVTGNHTVSGDVSVAGDVILTGADCAERFDLDASQTAESGTVMVIGEDGSLRPSERAYDRRVAGVVSGAGAFRPGIVLDKRADDEGRTTIALVGKVYCKVDADAAPIAVGDLLTTSATSGHAMKAADPMKAFGAVIGKALRPMASGRGLLPILVALQ